MDHTHRRTDIPVLLLYNIDPGWKTDEQDIALKAAEMLQDGLRREGHPVVGVPVMDKDLAAILAPYHPDEYVVLNWCEELPGKPRSEGLVAEILEELNFVYTGSSPDVLGLCWDKVAVKKLLECQGINTPAGQVMDTAGIETWTHFPAIVKPAREHCSVGITPDAVVMDHKELEARVAFVQGTFKQQALVEAFIDGREFHVSLLGNGKIHALPAAEMDFSAFTNMKDRLCTFESKFTPDSISYQKIKTRVPAPLTQNQISLLNQTAKDAYQAMECRDYARIDVRMDNGIFYVLDVNPNPDLSADTSMVSSAEAAGLSYGTIASWIVNLAAERHPVFSGKA